MLERQLPLVWWLDAATAYALRRAIALIVAGGPDVQAIILFGSVARREERPLTDQAPSDVDVLVIFDPPASTQQQTLHYEREEGAESLTPRQQALLSQAVIRALQAFPDTARDLSVTGALPPFAHWGRTFLEHVAQDGLLLWARTSPPDLPSPLEAVGQRMLSKQPPHVVAS